MASVSRFSTRRSCFFFARLSFVGFRITWTISAFRSFSRRRFRFSSRRRFFSSRSRCLPSCSCRASSRTSLLSCRSFTFRSQEARRGLSRTISENLFLPGSFHTRPDLGLPRGMAATAASCRFLAALRRRGAGAGAGAGAGPGAGAELGASPPGPAAAAAAASPPGPRRPRGAGGAVQLPHLPGGLPPRRRHRGMRAYVLRGVPAALPPGAVPALPALPHAVRPQEGGEGLQRGEAALVLQGPLQRLQQKGDPSQNAVSRLVLCEGAGADGQLPQVRPRCPHVPAYPQQYSQSLHVRVPVLRGPEPGPAGAGEALHGEPPQRPQQSGVPGVLGHALGGPQLQERQLPPAPPPQAQVFLRHLRGLQHRRGGSTAGCSGSVSLRELRAAAELLFASDPLSRPFCTLDLPAGEARSSWPPRDPPPLFPLLSGLIPPP